MTRSWAEGG